VPRARADQSHSRAAVDDVSHANARTHYRFGEELFHDEQFAKAADEFQIAVKSDPLLTIAHYELGQSSGIEGVNRGNTGPVTSELTGRDTMIAHLEHRITELERNETTRQPEGRDAS
jgi:hypothetical protein